MYWDVKAVKPLPDYRIYVEIEDGRRGVFDMKPYLQRGVFQELKDVNYFNQVGILFGSVTWPHEQDIAHETLLVPWNIIFFAWLIFVGWVRQVYAVTQHDQVGNIQGCWVTR